MKNKQNKDKNVICRVDDELYSELEQCRELLGINWSYQLRDFLKRKTVELKPQLDEKKIQYGITKCK